MMSSGVGKTRLLVFRGQHLAEDVVLVQDHFVDLAAQGLLDLHGVEAAGMYHPDQAFAVHQRDGAVGADEAESHGVDGRGPERGLGRGEMEAQVDVVRRPFGAHVDVVVEQKLHVHGVVGHVVPEHTHVGFLGDAIHHRKHGRVVQLGVAGVQNSPGVGVLAVADPDQQVPVREGRLPVANVVTCQVCRALQDVRCRDAQVALDELLERVQAEVELDAALRRRDGDLGMELGLGPLVVLGLVLLDVAGDERDLTHLAVDVLFVLVVLLRCGEHLTHR